jgi:hypothetical protein
VLLYNNWKEQRIGRQLPIHEPTAKLIIAQQKGVRERFPDRPPSQLVLLPSLQMNLRGDRSIDSNHLSGMHREWVESLPDFVLDDGTVFDKEKIFRTSRRSSKVTASAVGCASCPQPSKPSSSTPASPSSADLGMTCRATWSRPMAPAMVSSPYPYFWPMRASVMSQPSRRR